MTLPVPKAGRQFSRLKVLYSEPVRAPGGQRTMICRCDCGQAVAVPLPDLWSAKVQSCGCPQRERAAQSAARARQARHEKRAADPAAVARCGSCGAGFRTPASLGRHYRRQHQRATA
jgi:hypothetical protein